MIADRYNVVIFDDYSSSSDWYSDNLCSLVIDITQSKPKRFDYDYIFITSLLSTEIMKTIFELYVTKYFSFELFEFIVKTLAKGMFVIRVSKENPQFYYYAMSEREDPMSEREDPMSEREDPMNEDTLRNKKE